MDSDMDFYMSDDFVREFFRKSAKEDRNVESEGFLAKNEGYNETMHSEQEEVEANPRRFIIEECIPACLDLWKKNIYTFMVSDYENHGECWIEVGYDELSSENRRIYDGLAGEDVIKFSYHEGCVNFGVNCVGSDAQRRLLELADEFEMQDVPYGLAYVSPEDFVVYYCDVYDEIPNPNYREMKSLWEIDLDYREQLEYMREYEKWMNSDDSQPTIKVFNPDKLTKSIDELAMEHGMIYDGDRVYLSDFHYKKHQKYLEYLEKGMTGKSI